MDTWFAQYDALKAHRGPVDEREAQSWIALETFRRDESRDLSVHHITGSAIVLSERGVILLEHKHLGIWVQPGGHINPGENPQQAALRESREETGLPIRYPRDEIRLVHIDVHEGGRGHIHYDFRYLLQGMGVDPAPPLGESQAVQWCDRNTLLELADPGVIGLFTGLDPAQTSLCAHLHDLSVLIP